MNVYFCAKLYQLDLEQNEWLITIRKHLEVSFLLSCILLVFRKILMTILWFNPPVKRKMT